MYTWATLEPLSVTVEPGTEADTLLRIKNTGDVAEEYHVDVVGDPALWCTAEPATLRLRPGATGTVRLTFAPPEDPGPAIGPHPYGARVRPLKDPGSATVPEGSVAVGPYGDGPAGSLPVLARADDSAAARNVTCPWCATPNPPGRHFCRWCGISLAKSPETDPAGRVWWRRLLERVCASPQHPPPVPPGRDGR